MRWLGLALMAATPLAAQAEIAPLFAEYSANSGSLPPEYAWDVEVVIRLDGDLTLTRCTGYETTGPACKIHTATVTPAAIDVIRAAVKSTRLDRKAARKSDAIMVGGGSHNGAVYLNGKTIVLPAFPATADAPRVTTVMDAILAAIPADLQDRYIGAN